MQKTRIITHSALLLAVALAVQSLRLAVPLPMSVSMLIVGTGINLVLLILAYHVCLRSAMLIGAILPIVAFMQGQLPMVVFCPAVALANIIFVYYARRWQGQQTVWLAPMVKAGALLGMSYLIVEAVGFPPAVRNALLFMMGFGQLTTAMIALIIEKKLEKYIFCRKNY